MLLSGCENTYADSPHGCNCRVSGALACSCLFLHSSHIWDASSSGSNRGVWEGLAIGLVLAMIASVAALRRVKPIKSARRKLNELADHREYERTLSEQEAVQLMEEER